MFGWVERAIDRAATALYRRGQALSGAADRRDEERRQAIRDVRAAINEAMTQGEHDRNHGRDEARDAAITAANRARSLLREIDDEPSQELVGHWKVLWDGIEKGYKEGNRRSSYDVPGPPG